MMLPSQRKREPHGGLGNSGAGSTLITEATTNQITLDNISTCKIVIVYVPLMISVTSHQQNSRPKER